jgi:hypothetical protein
MAGTTVLCTQYRARVTITRTLTLILILIRSCSLRVALVLSSSEGAEEEIIYRATHEAAAKDKARVCSAAKGNGHEDRQDRQLQDQHADLERIWNQ